MAPTAKGLLLDLVGTVRRGSMPARALVAAGALFEIDENNVRVTLARLLADRMIERDQRGAYRPGPASRGVQSLVAEWRRTDERTVRWNGEWIAAVSTRATRSDRGSGRRGEHALALLGFESRERGLRLRPANLAGGIDAARRRLRELGLEESTMIATMADLDPDADRKARALWDGDAIAKAYDRAIARLETSRRRLAGYGEARAMAESFTLGGAAIRQIVRDPLLPPPFVASGALARLVTAARDYDAAGRSCWRPFLERHGVDFARAPVHLADTEGSGLAAGSLG